MSRIGNKELSTSLSDKHGLSKVDAERFVTSVFEVINEGLETDRLVKVKGLGILKIVSVAARKSVDVNTGEPIVIEGRDKISFTADATLRDEINKPFSQFDTVVLNEGVDFSKIDKEFEEDPKAAVLKAIGESTVKEQSEDTKPEVLEPDVPVNDVPVTGERQEVQYASEQTVDNSLVDVKLNGEEQETVEPSNEKSVNDENIVEEHQSNTLKFLIIAAAVIVLGCIGGGYYLWKQIEKRDHHIELLEKQMKIIAQNQKKNNVARIQSQYKQKPTDTRKTTLMTQSRIREKASDEEEGELSQEKALQAKYNRDPRIRTGAYIITGIKKTVTVRSGQTIDGISRTALGPGMECYVEAVNGGKRSLKVGEKINIPSLKLKKKAKRN